MNEYFCCCELPRPEHYIFSDLEKYLYFFEDKLDAENFGDKFFAAFLFSPNA